VTTKTLFHDGGFRLVEINGGAGFRLEAGGATRHIGRGDSSALLREMFHIAWTEADAIEDAEPRATAKRKLLTYYALFT
jgi:hypothetical protein